MVMLADKYHCTGCAACYQSCSKSAISMVCDEEGFLQPIIDENKCVECGLCSKRCPVLSPLERKSNNNLSAYALISYEDRKVSSSGGAFSVFAKWIFSQGGVVYGASNCAGLKVKHIRIDNVKDLCKLRGSKYVQSEMGSIFKNVKNDLVNGVKVLFVGTGCQVAGLYSFLNNKRYENLLYTLDLVCHGVPSQGCFDSYIGKLQKKLAQKGENIEGFRFRKFDSWDYRPAIKFSKSKEHILVLSENCYMEAFFKALIFRESCYNCQYCNTNRVGTFTIADFWGIGRHGKPFSKNVSAGVSLVLDNDGLMPNILSELSEMAYIEKRDVEEAIVEQRNLKEAMPRSKFRDTAVKDLLSNNISLYEYCLKYGLPCKATFKWKMAKFAKDIIYGLGLYNIYKTLIYKLGK